MTERDVITDRDVQVSDLKANMASPRSEPVLQPLGVRPDDLQRRCQIELNEVLRLMGDHSDGIFDSHGLRPSVDHRSDLDFGGLGEGFFRHGVAPGSRLQGEVPIPGRMTWRLSDTKAEIV